MTERDGQNRKSNEVADQVGPDRSTWSLMTSTNLEGKLGIIAAWYYDGETRGPAEDRQIVRRLVRAIQFFCRRKARRISHSDLYCLYDALASYPIHDPEIEEATRCIFELWRERDAQIHASQNLQSLVTNHLEHISADALSEAADLIQRELERRAGA